MDTMAANAASDMWSLGCIAYELLTGKEIFGSKYTDEEVMSMLIGYGAPLTIPPFDLSLLICMIDGTISHCFMLLRVDLS